MLILLNSHPPRRRRRHAHPQPAVPSLRRAESAAAVRHDAGHLRRHLYADHLPAVAGPSGRHCRRLPDLHVHLSAAADAEGAATRVRVDRYISVACVSGQGEILRAEHAWPRWRSR